MKKNQEQKLDDDDDDDRDDDKSGSKAAFVVTTKACVGLSTQRGPGTTTSQSGTVFVTLLSIKVTTIFSISSNTANNFERIVLITQHTRNKQASNIQCFHL